MLLTIFLLFCVTTQAAYSWTWQCNTSLETCTRVSTSQTQTTYPSLEVCRLVCGKYGALWPHPTSAISLSKNLIHFAISSIKFQFNANQNLQSYLQDISNLFSNSISYKDSASCRNVDKTINIKLSVISSVTNLKWNTDESYELQIQTIGENVNVNVASNTIFGIRHGLETLSQLIEPFPKSDETCLVMVSSASISDFPRFTHRGLLLDTARNFLSIDSIKRQIDAMGASKLNVLHWHITDSQSWPLEVLSLPNMTKYGAYASDKTYQPEEIVDLLSYALLRGVRIIIELDAPSHSGNGWQWGPDAGLGNLAVCVNQEPWRSYCIQPPCGQLNPINAHLYDVLKSLYSDVMGMMPDGEVLHMGGDEVFIGCWNATAEIIAFLGDKPRNTETFLELWGEYQRKALEVLDQVVEGTPPVILWTSHLTEVDVIEKYLDKERYVIQTWVPAADSLPTDLLRLGYRIIVSTKDAWYLDHGFWGTTMYHNWQTVYSNKLPASGATLGGEVCSWGEYVDDKAIDGRVWPRAAAAAERLWSNSNLTSAQAQTRFYRHRERLVSRGIKAEAVIPKWCYQNEGHC